MARTLRAPLNGLLGTLGLFSETPLTIQQTTYIDTARGSGEDVLGMVQNLLELAAMDAGELHITNSPLTLRRLVHESLEPFALLAHRKSIDLAGAIADGLPSGFQGDAERLRQVLTNLVSSAVHATEHGEVIVNVSAAPAEVAASTAGIRIATDGSRTRAQGARQGPAGSPCASRSVTPPRHHARRASVLFQSWARNPPTRSIAPTATLVAKVWRS